MEDKLLNILERIAVALEKIADNEIDIRPATKNSNIQMLKHDEALTENEIDLVNKQNYKANDTNPIFRFIDSLLNNKTTSLSLFMLKDAVDSYRFVNRGKEGVLCELKWHIHQTHIEDIDKPLIYTSETSTEKINGIKVLLAEDAVQIARLIYKSYGLSYVNEDIYYPERIRARLDAGALQSMGVA